MRIVGPTFSGGAFSLREYYDGINRAGLIPVSLIRWQLTGKADQIRLTATGR